MFDKIGKNQNKDLNYKVILDIFEGPLDLLIHLIKKEQINIYDVSISKITDQYLAFLETMRILDFNIAGEFLSMAATLIYIKSQTLLYPKDLPEEDALIEQKEDLIKRLVEYEKYKKATEQLTCFAQERNKVFCRPACRLESIEEKSSNIKAEISELVLALQSVLHKIEEKEILIPMKITEIDIKDKIRQVLVFLCYNQTTYLKQILEGNYGKQNIVVTFLALLELVKTGNIQIYQSVPFGELKIYASNIFSEHKIPDFGEEHGKTLQPATMKQIA